MAFSVNSYPQKSAAISGTALNNAGTNPLYKAKAPSLRINSRKASRAPRGYFSSEAVQITFVNTSAARPTNHVHHTVPAMPQRPPLGTLHHLVKCLLEQGLLQAIVLGTRDIVPVV